MNQRYRHPNTLPAWLDTALGRSLVQAEYECLQDLLPRLFGPVAVQVSVDGFGSFLTSSNAAFCYVATLPPQEPAGSGVSDLRCVPEQLPFEAKTVGLVILPHVLEFSDYPHQILREIDRILVPEGHVVVLGFNPFSLWGLVSLFRRSNMPWNGRFSSPTRIKDWMQLLNFELSAGKMLYYKPPVQSERVRSRMNFIDKVGDRWWPLCAAVYAVVARKREIGVTPLQPGWKKKTRLHPGLAKPVARISGVSYGRHDAG